MLPTSLLDKPLSAPADLLNALKPSGKRSGLLVAQLLSPSNRSRTL